MSPWLCRKRQLRKWFQRGASAAKKELFRFTSGDYTSNMRSAGVAGEASPAAATSRHCFLLQQWGRDGNTLIWSLTVTGFLLLALFCLSGLWNNAERCTVKQEQASGQTAQTKRRDLRGLMQTAEERAKVAVRERSDRTVPANPHHTRMFLLYTCLSPL